MTPLCIALVVVAATLALGLWWTRARLAAAHRELAQQRATVEAARVLYGEARMWEAARVVSVRTMAKEDK